MCGNLPEGLLADVKNYLQITWEDQATDARIGGLVSSGMFYLDSRAGTQQDYTVPGHARTLLMEYVRYARDAALEVFEGNYLHEIIEMQTEAMVDAETV